MQEQDGDEDAYDESTVPGAAEAAPRPAEPSPADPPAEPPSNESLAAESAAPAAGAGTTSSGLAVNLVELCVCYNEPISRQVVCRSAWKRQPIY